MSLSSYARFSLAFFPCEENEAVQLKRMNGDVDSIDCLLWSEAVEAIECNC